MSDKIIERPIIERPIIEEDENGQEVLDVLMVKDNLENDSNEKEK